MAEQWECPECKETCEAPSKGKEYVVHPCGQFDFDTGIRVPWCFHLGFHLPQGLYASLNKEISHG